jgi:hypothetical protein
MLNAGDIPHPCDAEVISANAVRTSVCTACRQTGRVLSVKGVPRRNPADPQDQGQYDRYPSILRVARHPTQGAGDVSIARSAARLQLAAASARAAALIWGEPHVLSVI